MDVRPWYDLANACLRSQSWAWRLSSTSAQMTTKAGCFINKGIIHRLKTPFEADGCLRQNSPPAVSDGPLTSPCVASTRIILLR